jgi:hypothetical protein
MAVAQGLYKKVAYKKQTGLGVAAAGSGGQLIRRDKATFAKVKDTFSSDEINSYQQYSGDNFGSSKTTGSLDGELSPKTYADFLGSLNRGAFVAGVSATGASLTIAGTGPTFTITRAAGSYLTDGFKVGDVVQITAGTYTGIAKNLNLVVTALTATVMTVVVPNGKVLAAQGPIASSTIAVVGKKSVTPSSGQLNDYYTIEEWLSDISKSRLYTDMQVASADITIPANGDCKINLAFMGLGRTLGNAQVLTTPTTETSTFILSGVNAVIMVNGMQQLTATSLNLKVDGQLAPGEAVIGSKTISDNVKGDIKVSGSFSVVKQDETNSTLFENETAVQIIAAVFNDTTDNAAFVSFSIPAVSVLTDETDDGKKQIVSSHNFTAEYNGLNGGAALATDTGIISIQDSAA